MLHCLTEDSAMLCRHQGLPCAALTSYCVLPVDMAYLQLKRMEAQWTLPATLGPLHDALQVELMTA